MKRSEDQNDRKRRRSRSRSRSPDDRGRRGRDEDRRDSRRRRSPERRSRSRSPDRRENRSNRRDEPRKEDRNQGSSGAGNGRSQTGPAEAVKEKLSSAEQEAAALEEEMRKRRERVKAWQEARAQQQKAEQAAIIGSDQPSSVLDAETEESVAMIAIEEEQQRWTLEDEQEDDEADDLEADASGVEALPALSSSSNAVSNQEEEETGPAMAKALSNPSKSTVAALPLTLKAIKASASISRSVKKSSSSSLGTSGSRWDKDNDRKTPIAVSVKMEEEPEEDEVDPLDAFMTGLLGSGQVAEQSQLLPSSLQRGRHDANRQDEDDEDMMGVDLHGTHVITLDQILRQQQLSSSSSFNNSSKPVLKRGWESDSEMDTNDIPDTSTSYNHDDNHESNDLIAAQAETGERMESGETEEERDERERQEFLAAIKQARLEEEAALSHLHSLQTNTAATATANTSKGGGIKGKDMIGRQFEGDADLLQEEEAALAEQRRKSALDLLEEAKRGKSLKPVDHSKIAYLPFRKNLFVVPRAIAKLTEAEVETKRLQLAIKVRGKGCPCPVDTWSQCGLSDRILDMLAAMKLDSPFAIQQQAIPAIIAGRDIIGVAKTGSGKTLAFLLPLLRHVLDQPPIQEGDGPIALVMAPARELASQIFHTAKRFAKGLNLRAACIYGGAGVAEQIADLKRGAEIVICTPGRMIDILSMQAGKLISLKRVSFVVMDEADRMFDMGFGPQISMILNNVRPDRQVALFSATFPKQIEKLARAVLKLPLEIIVGERGAVNKDITQFVEVHEDDDKFLRLLQLLGLYYEAGSILIFVDTQERCDQLFSELLKLGYPCLSLHGGKDQVDREHTLHEFKSGIKTVLVSTSVAGRGLDVPAIVCVVNYSCPNHLEDYTHRCGRTGRAGRKGVAYTFLSTKEEQYSSMLVKALTRAGQAIPPELEAMATVFKEKVGRGEANWAGSNGFDRVKGFKFDGAEMNEAQKIALMQKRQYELEQGLVPEDDEDMMMMDDMDTAMIEDNNGGNNNTSSISISNSNSNKILLLEDVGGSGAPSAAINRPSNSSSNPGAVALDPHAATLRAKLIAQQLLGKKEDGTQDLFTEELEINDYPAQARKKVTAKTALDDITERTGVAIISRGVFVQPGKQPALGERRLHLIIKGSSELSVRQARNEILRTLEEETLRLAAVPGGGGGGAGSSAGRYSVI